MSEQSLKIWYHPLAKEIIFKRFRNGEEIAISDASKLRKYMRKKGNFTLQDEKYEVKFLNDIAAAFEGEKEIDIEIITTKKDFEYFAQMVSRYNENREDRCLIKATMAGELADSDEEGETLKETIDNLLTYHFRVILQEDTEKLGISDRDASRFILGINNIIKSACCQKMLGETGNTELLEKTREEFDKKYNEFLRNFFSNCREFVDEREKGFADALEKLFIDRTGMPIQNKDALVCIINREDVIEKSKVMLNDDYYVGNTDTIFNLLYSGDFPPDIASSTNDVNNNSSVGFFSKVSLGSGLAAGFATFLGAPLLVAGGAAALAAYLLTDDAANASATNGTGENAMDNEQAKLMYQELGKIEKAVKREMERRCQCCRFFCQELLNEYLGQVRSKFEKDFGRYFPDGYISKGNNG